MDFSHELYDKVKALTEGDKPKFESLSDYLNYVVAADLGKREPDFSDFETCLVECLNSERVRRKIKEVLE